MLCIDLITGEKIWSHKSGWWIDSSPAVTFIDGKCLVYFGSYDRSIHCVNGQSGEYVWHVPTGNAVYSSPVIASIREQRVVFAASWDNFLYGCNALTGKVLWKYNTGEFTWSYMERGDSHWSSPIVVQVDSQAMLFFGSYDGQLYAFKDLNDGSNKISEIQKSEDFNLKFFLLFVLVVILLILITIKVQKKRD